MGAHGDCPPPRLGLSNKKIAHALHHTGTTIAHHLERFKKGCQPAAKPLRQYKLTAVKTELLHAIDSKPLRTLTLMLAWLKDKKGIVVGRNTLRTSLIRWGCLRSVSPHPTTRWQSPGGRRWLHESQ